MKFLSVFKIIEVNAGIVKTALDVKRKAKALNLKYIKQWYLFYSDGMPISQQPVGQITKKFVPQSTGNAAAQDVLAQITAIPWGHNIAIISKCRDTREALFYVKNTVEHNWSRNVLAHQIESGLYKREGKSVTNFALTLPDS
jgi:hypothetical protein